MSKSRNSLRESATYPEQTIGSNNLTILVVQVVLESPALTVEEILEMTWSVQCLRLGRTLTERGRLTENPIAGWARSGNAVKRGPCKKPLIEPPRHLR